MTQCVIWIIYLYRGNMSEHYAKLIRFSRLGILAVCKDKRPSILIAHTIQKTVHDRVHSQHVTLRDTLNICSQSMIRKLYWCKANSPLTNRCCIGYFTPSTHLVQKEINNPAPPVTVAKQRTWFGFHLLLSTDHASSRAVTWSEIIVCFVSIFLLWHLQHVEELVGLMRGCWLHSDRKAS